MKKTSLWNLGKDSFAREVLLLEDHAKREDKMQPTENPSPKPNTKSRRFRQVISWNALRMEDVGSAVRRKRKALGYTLEQMSNVTHISKRTLIKLEAGEDVRYSTLLVALSAVGLALSFNATSLEDLEAIENGTFELDDGAFWV